MDFSLITNEPLDYCVYAHVNKYNGKIYIGISNNPKARWGSNGGGYNRSTHFKHAIKKYGWNSFDHIILIDKLPLIIAQEIERTLIEKYDTTNQGYNIKAGGEGGGQLRGKHHLSKPIYQYDLMGNFVKAWECPIDAERYYNIRDITRTVIEKNNGRRTAAGFQWTYEYSDHISPYTTETNKKYTPIYQYTLEGDFIKKWDYQKDAVDKYGESIKACAYGISKSSHGYRWSFEQAEHLSTSLEKHEYRRTIPVIQKTLGGEFIKRYKTATDAATEMHNGKKSPSTTILRVCHGERQSAYGYLWEFDENEGGDNNVQLD